MIVAGDPLNRVQVAAHAASRCRDPRRARDPRGRAGRGHARGRASGRRRHAAEAAHARAVGRAEPACRRAARSAVARARARATATPRRRARASSGARPSPARPIRRSARSRSSSPMPRSPDYVLARLVGLSRAAGRSDDAHVARGFTLIELLIALAILGARRGARLSRARRAHRQRGAARRGSARTGATLDALFARLEADARGALPRDVRTGAGTRAGVGRRRRRSRRRRPALLARRAGIRASNRGAPDSASATGCATAPSRSLYWPHLDQPSAVAPAGLRAGRRRRAVPRRLSRRARRVARPLAGAGRARRPARDARRADARRRRGRSSDGWRCDEPRCAARRSSWRC